MANYRSRVERKAQIFDALWIAKNVYKKDYLTTHGIAKEIGLVPSTKLRHILREMEAEGTIKSRGMVQKNGWPVVHWSHVRPPRFARSVVRSIPVKTAGVEIIRMELI